MLPQRRTHRMELNCPQGSQHKQGSSSIRGSTKLKDSMWLRCNRFHSNNQAQLNSRLRGNTLSQVSLLLRDNPFSKRTTHLQGRMLHRGSSSLSSRSSNRNKGNSNHSKDISNRSKGSLDKKCLTHLHQVRAQSHLCSMLLRLLCPLRLTVVLRLSRLRHSMTLISYICNTNNKKILKRIIRFRRDLRGELESRCYTLVLA